MAGARAATVIKVAWALRGKRRLRKASPAKHAWTRSGGRAT